MTAEECAQQIIAKIAPQLSELGVDAFVLTAYIRATDDNGNEVVERHVIASGGGNVAMQDGLRPMVIMGSRWQQGQL